MFQKQNQWFSEFPPVEGKDQPISKNVGVVAVTASNTPTGGHAAIYLEFIDSAGHACERMVHLQYTPGGSDPHEGLGSRSAESSGEGDANQIVINIEPKAVVRANQKRSEKFIYRSYVVTNAQIDAVIREADNFKADVAAGRYVYRLLGGIMARLTTTPTKRGVNCADFCDEILHRADIKKRQIKFIRTPRSVAQGKKGRTAGRRKKR